MAGGWCGMLRAPAQCSVASDSGASTVIVKSGEWLESRLSLVTSHLSLATVLGH